MKKILLAVLVCVLLLGSIPVFADLQNVLVGGEIRLRGNWIRSCLPGKSYLPFEQLYPAAYVPGRPIGGLFGSQGVFTTMAWDGERPSYYFVEQRTRLNVKADFTEDVRAFIELDSYDVWGEDFRSNYLTGIDSRSSSGITPTLVGPDGDVEVFQAYVEADKMFGTPLRLRIGRQELSFGSQFLVGTGDKAPLFRGISFDAVRLTYAGETFSVDGWWSKLAERSPLEEDGDVDFYGVYASCKAIENMVFDAYWLYLRDAQGLRDTNAGIFGNWFEHKLGVDDYDVTNLHTVGGRAAGKWNALDFEAEVAYQFGNYDSLGSTFRPILYGDTKAREDNWGGHVEVGYTFDLSIHPRLFGGVTYFGGNDRRKLGLCEWFNPFIKPKSSVSFNRLFSNQIYSGFVDLNDDFSNGYDIRAGAMCTPTDKLWVMLCVSYFSSVEEFARPVTFKLGPWYIPISPFLMQSNDRYLGTEAYLAMTYQYSKDLMFEAGWAHWFLGEGGARGNFSAWNGTMLNGGHGDDDGDYIYVGSKLSF